MMELILPVMPWVVLCLGILATMLASIVRVDTKRPAQFFALLTLGLTMASALSGVDQLPQLYAGCMEVSALTQLLLALFSGVGIFFILGCSRYLSKEGLHLSDYYHLLLILILGASVLASAKDLTVVFIALEVMSLPAYTLAGFRRSDPRSNEAAIKYYILGGALGAVFLLGSSFLFGATGSTHFAEIYAYTGDSPLFFVGHMLVMIAFLFKVAAAPFHFWKPDVYEGAPISVTGIMATIITSAAFVTLTRLVHLPNFEAANLKAYAQTLKTLIAFIAGASLIVGSVIMITQNNLKRLLAYSAISHTGYLLLGLLGTFQQDYQYSSIWIYLIGYTLMSSGLFVLISQSNGKSDSGMELVDLTGLLKRSPFVASLFCVFFLSMAGMPFTIGFFTKYSVMISSLAAGEYIVVIISALCAVVSAYAYLRPLGLMVMRDADPGAAAFEGSMVSRSVAFCSALAVIYLGVMPNMLISILKGIPLLH